MKYIKLYEKFKTNKSLYRTTVFEWLSDFLDKGLALPLKDNKYISFSKDENSGDIDSFGDIRIEFDAIELYKQGAIEIEYTLEFFKENPDLCLYVTGYKNEKAYNADMNENDWTWEEYIKSFKNEKEVVLKKFKMKPNLIKTVTVWDADERSDIPHIKELMKLHNIKVEVPWE